MSRVLYIECFSGAAGDMLLGAFIDAGLPVDALNHALGSLGVDHEVRAERVVRAGVTATHIEVVGRGAHASAPGHAHDHRHPHEHGHGHEHRSLKEIARLIGQSALSPAGKERAIALFRRLAEAEAAIHNMSVDDVHLHEVGAVDSIIDIVGAVFAFEWFGIDDVVSSPLNVGGGSVEIAHGTYPVPAPATLRLLSGVPVYSSGIRMELVTPTGALLVSSYAKGYGPMPAMTVESIGYGAGTRDLERTPNVVRMTVGVRRGSDPVADVIKVETELDDMNPQIFGPVSDRLFAEGALDVFLTAVQMKKGRPGTLITVLAPPDRQEAVCDVLFSETTTLGVRVDRVSRVTLDRKWEEVTVDGAVVRIKVASRGGVVMNAVPEFEDCLRIAERTHRPVKTVLADAVSAWQARGRS